MTKSPDKIYAPELDELLRRAQADPVIADAKTRDALMGIVKALEPVKICGGDERRMLWFRIERGGIEAYGDYNELLEAGEIDSREDFER